MIRMLPIVDALRQTSHMAGRRNQLEEKLDGEENDQRIRKEAWKAIKGFDDASNVMNSLRFHVKASGNSRAAQHLAATERYLHQARNEVSKLIK